MKIITFMAVKLLLEISVLLKKYEKYRLYYIDY